MNRTSGKLKINWHFRKPLSQSKAERERIGKWEPERMENGETLPQIVSRSKHIILKHWSKWNEQQKTGQRIFLVGKLSFKRIA